MLKEHSCLTQGRPLFQDVDPDLQALVLIVTSSACVQDRFTSLVPALTKYGATTVGVTLLVIGVAGLYETLTEGAEVADQAQPALAGDSTSLIPEHFTFWAPTSLSCML